MFATPYPAFASGDACGPVRGRPLTISPSEHNSSVKRDLAVDNADDADHKNDQAIFQIFLISASSASSAVKYLEAGDHSQACVDPHHLPLSACCGGKPTFLTVSYLFEEIG
jgi:hypothetical protein